MPEDHLIPHSPFENLAVAAAGRGVTVSDCDGLGLATVLVRNGQTAALAARLKEGFGIDLPRTPRRVAHGGVALAGVGPGAWLATAEDGGNAFAASLRKALAGVAAVIDQTDGYAVLRVSGPKVRETLAKGLPLDLHGHAFRAGDVAVSSVSHVGTTLWRLADDAGGLAVFEIVVFRSLSESFWHWLSESTAEFGLSVAGTERA
jgi:sarcosine oxidase subunit gamma